MKKKILMMFFLMFMLLITGCSEKGGKGEDENNGKEPVSKNTIDMPGRYVEKEMELPQLVGEEVINFISYNKNSRVEVYTTDRKGGYFCYELSEQWNKSHATWISSIEELKNDGYVKGLQQGEDGFKYVMVCGYMEDEKKEELFIYRTKDDGITSEKVETPYLEKRSSIKEFRVLEDGSIVINDGINNTLKIYSGADGKETGSVKFGNKASVDGGLGVKGNKIITIDESGKSIIVYDTKKAQVEQSFEYDFVKDEAIWFSMSDDGTVYAVDKRGLHMVKLDGTIWETIIEGSGSSIGTSVFNNLIVEKGEPEKYYIFTRDKVFEYSYDEKIDAVSEKEISIYSMYEEEGIKSLISKYQIDNPNIKINYISVKKYGPASEGDIQKSDIIRALNTELLAGKGPDILILDELPTKSYIERGILADMSEIINPMIEGGDLVKNIAEAYKKEDGIYQMPLSFKIPVVIGNKDAIINIEGLEDIVDYIKENPKITFLKDIDSKDLIIRLLSLEYDKLMKNDTLDKQEFIRFLENLKIVSENADSESVEYDNFYPGFGIMGNQRFDLIDKKCEAYFDEIAATSHLKRELLIEENFDKYYRKPINKMFLPVLCISLNNSSKEKEAALDFIKTLFSKEYQELCQQSGYPFPVNEKLLTEYIMKDDNVGYILSHRSDNKRSYATDNLTNEAKLKFLDELREWELNKPLELGSPPQDIIVEFSLKYLSGSMSAEQTAETVASKINTYLSE